jgi:hypothetical protein
MPFLPSSTNAQYAGAPIAAHFLTLVGVLTILPGLIHTFLPDGGAGVIAGLDLSVNGAIVIGVFAWAGATQIVWGTALLVASRRYRSLVPPLLVLVAIERALIALNIWVLKTSPSGHRPPEAYATLISLPLLLAAIALSVRDGRSAAAIR